MPRTGHGDVFLSHWRRSFNLEESQGIFVRHDDDRESSGEFAVEDKESIRTVWARKVLYMIVMTVVLYTVLGAVLYGMLFIVALLRRNFTQADIAIQDMLTSYRLQAKPTEMETERYRKSKDD
jgi:hypothetical protein